MQLTTTMIIYLILGVLLLFFGRRLFWLFVGVAGFVAGFNLASQILGSQPEWVLLLVGLVAGLIGMVLAVLLQRLAVAIAGFLVGGSLVTTLFAAANVNLGNLSLVTYIIGGLLGLLLVIALFDWALIILSSLFGASLIVQSFTLAASMAALLFVILFVIGIAVQAGLTSPVRTRRAERAGR
jgi:hypothetical protein